MSMNELELWKRIDKLTSVMETLVLQLSDVLLYLQYPIIKKETTNDEETKHLRPAGAVTEYSGGKDADERDYEDNPTAQNDKRAGDGGTGPKKK